MAGKLRGLYAVTPECRDRDRLLADVEAALRGGCRFVQYRDKTSAAPERVTRAHALRSLTLDLLINNAGVEINGRFADKPPAEIDQIVMPALPKQTYFDDLMRVTEGESRRQCRK